MWTQENMTKTDVSMISNDELVVNNKNYKSNDWWNRTERAEKLEQYKGHIACGSTQRDVATMLNVPRSTLREWAKWGEHLDDNRVLILFLESSVGIAFLHRLNTALHFVFVELGACGIRSVTMYLKLTGLDNYIASSYESQRKINLSIQKEIVDHAEKQKEQLAINMKKKDITTAQDETFAKGIPCLVAIEPSSNYILLEQQANGRDAETWATTMTEAVRGINCTIIQVTGDLGKGLVSYAQNILGVQHSPDLFHVQQDISRAVSAPIAAKARSAERQMEDAEEQLALIMATTMHHQEDSVSQGRGRPIDFENRITRATEDLTIKQAEAARLNKLRADLRSENKK